MPTYILFLLLFIINKVISSSDMKTSLTFVIDRSGSMHNVIDQVRRDADSIFDVVMNSKYSEIVNFVLVTFEDSVSLETVTKDRKIFKEALADFKVEGGGDCPENSLTAIKLALETSLDASSLYIFTDASAKDYKMASEIEVLSQKKQIQLVFVLTEDCGSRRDEEYAVYETLAVATSGQVFHLDEYDIDKILKYIKYSISSRKNMIAAKTLTAGESRKFNVTVDGDTKELVISVSGEKATVGVTDSKGSKMPTEFITDLPEIAVVKVSDVNPGVYGVEVYSETDSRVVVTGTTRIHFRHGFSLFRHSAISDATTRPIPGKESYLSIKLAAEGNVELHSVQILDMEDNLDLEKPLNLMGKADRLYTSVAPFVPPNHLFRIAIKGYDRDSKTFFTRLSLTPIKPQETTVTVVEKAPKVNINGGEKTEAKFGQPFQLKCKVSGYPKPDVTWESEDPTAVLNHTESEVEIPFDFLSVLYIKNVTKRWKYTCKATNKLNTDSKSITVDLKRKEGLKILRVSNDTSIEYQKRGELFCQVDAFPPVTVMWTKDRKDLATDANVLLSKDNSVLTIRSMGRENEGNYICVVRNELYRNVYPFEVSITGVERPKLNKNVYEIVQIKHSNVDIKCDLIRGKPKPTYSWFYSPETSPFGPFKELYHETSDSIHIENVSLADGGRYRCRVTNIMGRDANDIDLIVEYPPTQTASVRDRVAARAGDEVTLPCPAQGEPAVYFRWLHNGEELPSTDYTPFRDGSLRFEASLSRAGKYECEASNDHGHIQILTYLDVNVPVSIEIPKESMKTVLVGTDVELPCKATGFPEPIVSWIFYSKGSSMVRNLRPSDSSGALHIKIIQLKQDGFYTCMASNADSSHNISYTINVAASPLIWYTKKQFTSVLDDYVLQIPCNATGNPKPDIIWKHNGNDIGPPWYFVDEEGTLSVFDVNEKSGGNYACNASNMYGADHQVFEAIVNSGPVEETPESTIWLEEGTPANISCDVPRLRTDRLRWFKERKMISKEELFLKSLTQFDSGVYTCRVSSDSGVIKTHSIKVQVGTQPKFIFNDPKYIKFEIETFVTLSCDASGKPIPEYRWFHNDKPLPVFKGSHEVEMMSSEDKGRYKCIVSNIFGTIQQEYRIDSYECVLDIKKDFNGNQPMILPRFKATDGHIRIPGGKLVRLLCPNSRNVFKAIRARQITMECVNEKQFAYGRDKYQFSDLKCSETAKIVVKASRNRYYVMGMSVCEINRVGFDTPWGFVEVYQVCLDLTTRNPVFTNQTIDSFQAGVWPEYSIKWHNWDWPPYYLDSLYDCSQQEREISWMLHEGSRGCCFARRQLVSALTVAPGLYQVATYSRLNAAPQWGTCNSQNWMAVESRVMSLAKTRRLQVWTGTAGSLQNVTFTFGSYPKVDVAEYFWKVVQDQATESSIAIVQVNVPDLQRRDALRYQKCQDICLEVDWMRNGHNWRKFAQGYTYCCHLKQFEDAFKLHGVFPSFYRVLVMGVF